MRNRNITAKLTGMIALTLAATTGAVTMPISAAHGQAYSPMPPACSAASSAAQSEGSRYSNPPSEAGVIVNMQHIMFLTGLLLHSLEQSCRGWGDYERTHQQFQRTYDATLQNCQAVASNPADCVPKAYGS